MDKEKKLNLILSLTLALVFGFLVVVPTLFSIFKIGWNNWQGVYPLFNKDEIYYLSLTREVADGHLGLGNAFIAEHKNEPFLQPPLAELIFTGFSKFTGLSVPGVFVAGDFVLIFLMVLATYWLFYAVTQSRRLTFFVVGFFFLIFLLAFNRPINPQFSFLWLILGLGAIWRIAQAQNNFREIFKSNLWLVLFFGVALYTYPYCWTALLVVYGLVLLFKTRDWGWGVSIKSGAVFALGAVVVGLPYLINQVKVLSSPFYNETFLRSGLLNIHWPGAYVNAGLLILSLALFFLAKNKINRPQFNFSLALLLGGLILNWQNVITGKYLQFSSHYYQVTILFVLLALTIFMAGFFCQRINLKERKTQIFLMGILLVMAFIFYRQINEIKSAINILRGESSKTMLEYQQMAGVFDWFNKNSLPDSVILSLSDQYSTFLPVYTSNNLYSYGYAGCHLMPDEEIENRWVRQNIFQEKVDASYIEYKYRVIWLNKFIDKYQNESIRNKIIGRLTGRKIAEPVLLPGFYVDRVLAIYNEVKKEDLAVALKKYKLDYILLNREQGQGAEIEEKLKNYRFVEVIARIDNIIIYEVN